MKLTPLVLGVLALGPLSAPAQTSSAPVSSSSPFSPEVQEDNPETQVAKAYPEDPSKIPFTSPDGKSTTLGAMAPKVLLVSVFTSRFGDMAELKLAPHLMKAFAGNKDVAFIALNMDRPKTQEDWDVLREVFKESGVEVPLYADARLSYLAWINGRPTPGTPQVIRTPSLSIVLNGKQLHGAYGIDPKATPEEYLAERVPQVKEALKAAGAKPAAATKPATKPAAPKH